MSRSRLYIYRSNKARLDVGGDRNPREEGEQPTSLGQSVAVVTVNDATSNAVGTPSVFISLSLSLFSISLFLFLFLFISTLFRRFLLLLARHRRFVSFLPRFASALVPRRSRIVWKFYRVSVIHIYARICAKYT